MKLDTLVQQIEKDGHSLSQKREQTAQDCLQRGVNLLQQAHAENFANLDLLSQSAESLIQVIQFNRSRTEPYLAMAYIFMLLDNDPAAQSYLKELLRLEPEHAEAQKLLNQTMRKPQLQQPAGAPANRPAPVLMAPSGRAIPQSPADIDCETLYDQLAVQILQEVKKVSHYPVIPPHPSQKIIKELRQYHAGMTKTLEQIQAQLKIVEREFEVQDLKTQLRPLEVMHRRFASAIETSLKLQALLERIESEKQLVREQLGSLTKIESQEDYTIMEENLETLLDGSDQLANEIEALEHTGFGCQEAHRSYSDLARDIEKLQDALDEMGVSELTQRCA